MAVLNQSFKSFVVLADIRVVNRNCAGFFAAAALLLLLADPPAASAAGLVLPRDSARTIELSTFTGKTYLQATLATNDGINAKTVTDYSTPVTISTVSQTETELGLINTNVVRDLYGYFKDREAGFDTLVGQIAGQSFAPLDLQSNIAPYLTNVSGMPYQAKVTAANLILLTSGSGTVVEMTPDDYFYNISYQPGKTSSGRSYAVTATRELLDPSDTDYLTELGNHLTAASPQEASNFYTAMFKVLTASDTSGLSSLTSTGQVVLTDFIGIYTAELMRHDMVGLVVTNDPWELDIGEVTLLSSYITASGMVIQDGKLVADEPKAYSHAGSIGTHIADFTKLARLITSYEKLTSSHHKATITSLNALTPVKTKLNKATVKGDIFRQTLVYLDQPQFEIGVQINASEITSAMALLLSQIRTDQSNITAYVLAHQ